MYEKYKQKLLNNRKLVKCKDETLDMYCWEWTKYVHSKKGYGHTWAFSATWGVHRLSFFLFKGNLIKGMQIDHLCANRACFNPAHLDQVTPRENVLRGNTGINNFGKTHCKHGHEYNEINTLWVNTYGKRAFYRKCRECRSQRYRANMSRL